MRHTRAVGTILGVVLLALLWTVWRSLGDAAEVPPVEITMLSPPPQSDQIVPSVVRAVAPDTPAADPQVAVWIAGMREATTQAETYCGTRPIGLACEGPMCAIRLPEKDLVASIVRRPMLMVELALVKVGLPTEISPCLTAVWQFSAAAPGWIHPPVPEDHPDEGVCLVMPGPGVVATDPQVAYASARLCNHLTQDAGFEPAYTVEP